jgi:hypothetical protein
MVRVVPATGTARRCSLQQACFYFYFFVIISWSSYGCVHECILHVSTNYWYYVVVEECVISIRLVLIYSIFLLSKKFIRFVSAHYIVRQIKYNMVWCCKMCELRLSPVLNYLKWYGLVSSTIWNFHQQVSQLGRASINAIESHIILSFY